MTFVKNQAAVLPLAHNSLTNEENSALKIHHSVNRSPGECTKKQHQYLEPTLAQSILSGGIGGALMVIVGHPLDLLKVRQQALTSSTASTNLQGIKSSGSANMFHDLKSIVKCQGYRGLYRGLATPLFAVAPTFAVEYGAFEMFQSYIRSHSGKVSFLGFTSIITYFYF